jgi:hypothetical protein
VYMFDGSIHFAAVSIVYMFILPSRIYTIETAERVCCHQAYTRRNSSTVYAPIKHIHDRSLMEVYSLLLFLSCICLMGV